MSIDEALASYCKRCGHMQSCERMCPQLQYELNEMAYEPIRLEDRRRYMRGITDGIERVD